MSPKDFWIACYLRVLGTTTHLGALITPDDAAAYADAAYALGSARVDALVAGLEGLPVDPGAG